MIKRKSSKLTQELIGILLFSLVIALLFIYIINGCSSIIIQRAASQEKFMATAELVSKVEKGVFSVSIIVAVCFFVVLFLTLVGIKLSYIEEVMKGIYALSEGNTDYEILPEGDNELTRLAEAVNFLSKTQKEMKEKEEKISREKEQFIRTLSHDIRTPLTAILSYSEYLLSSDEWEPEKQKEQIIFMKKKAERMKELTDILLDGGKRAPKKFENAKLLWEQLILEFEEDLEEEFQVESDLSCCLEFSGVFDVKELQRIFENLTSNIKKYADPAEPIQIIVMKEEKALRLKQRNKILKNRKEVESHQIGIAGIRRIAYSYKGEVKVETEREYFQITITLSEF